MNFASKISLSSLVLVLGAVACATATDETPSDPATTGGTNGVGTGGTTGTGSAAGTGSSSSTGGYSATGGAATGGAATGGAATGGASTGGAATGGATTGGASTGGAATGGASTGGAATGGASTGGAATGGTGGTIELTGECADKLTLAEWNAQADAEKAFGDLIVYTCGKVQGTCNSLDKVGKTYLFSCGQTHVQNCSQKPDDTNAWVLEAECTEDTGMGGAAP
jgi:hypothetical protein